MSRKFFLIVFIPDRVKKLTSFFSRSAQLYQPQASSSTQSMEKQSSSATRPLARTVADVISDAKRTASCRAASPLLSMEYSDSPGSIGLPALMSTAASRAVIHLSVGGQANPLSLMLPPGRPVPSGRPGCDADDMWVSHALSDARDVLDGDFHRRKMLANEHRSVSPFPKKLPSRGSSRGAAAADDEDEGFLALAIDESGFDMVHVRLIEP